MEVLNGAVEKLSTSKRRWVDVNVDIATSHIKISDVKVSPTGTLWWMFPMTTRGWGLTCTSQWLEASGSPAITNGVPLGFTFLVVDVSHDY